MRLTDLLSSESVLLFSPQGGGGDAKVQAISELSRVLARESGLPESTIGSVLLERERLQSTGIGEGVAIPHGSLDDAPRQFAALMVAPNGIDYDAIDGAKVTILFAVVGPRRASGEHLKTLARVSRLLKSRDFRERLMRAKAPTEVLELVRGEEGP